LGIVLGLAEAASLRLPDLPVVLMKPYVPPSFWFFAPLLASGTFGLLGLLAGFLAALSKRRFLGMVVISVLVGLAGAYLALALQFSLSGCGWFTALHRFITPPIVFTVFFIWTLPALWDTQKPDTPLGFLADVPLRLWSRVVFAAIVTLAVAVGISHLPDRLTATAAHAASRAKQPNIILIVWDTARADHFSSYGYSRNTTPNIDQFAERGVLFENAISASSWTLPAMASVFTSLLPHQHGAERNWGLGNGPHTLAEILRSGGYETAGFNGNPYFGVNPWGLGRGFETYIESTSSLGYSFDAARIGGGLIEPFREEWLNGTRVNQYTAQQLNEHVYRWFDHRSDRPYFLFLNYNDAHEPYQVPPPYKQLYGDASREARHLLGHSDAGRFYLPLGEREGVIAAYDHSLNYIDSRVGELLRFLESSPDWSNTYVIITADHGEGFGEHDTYTHGWNLNRETLHVPLIVVGPGIPHGVRVRDIARTRQIFSTVLEMAGMKKPVLQHNSLSRLWNPGYKPSNSDEATVSEVVDNTAPPAPQGMISLTTREWHFIYRAGYQRNELYHWPTDPLEQRNLANLPENQALVGQLKARLLSIVLRSYRPWRNTRYLLAFSKSDFSPDEEALKSTPAIPDGPLLHLAAGAPQALFPPNPETPQADNKNPDLELLKSLPYEGI